MSSNSARIWRKRRQLPRNRHYEAEDERSGNSGQNPTDIGGRFTLFARTRPLIPKSECHQVLTCDGRNILFAIDLIRHWTSDNLPAQARPPQERARARIKGLEVPLAPPGEEQI